MDAAFSFVETFGAAGSIVSKILGTKKAYDAIVPEGIVLSGASKFRQEAVRVDIVDPFAMVSLCTLLHGVLTDSHAAVIGCVKSDEPSVANIRSTRRSSPTVLSRCSLRALMRACFCACAFEQSEDIVKGRTTGRSCGGLFRILRAC